MKRILIIAGLAIFAATGSNAQNAKNCCCDKKAGYTAAHHKTTAAKRVAIKSVKPPLFSNRKHNTEVVQVPGTYPGNDVWRYDYSEKLDNADNVELNGENTYTGNYPKPTIQDTRITPRDAAIEGRPRRQSDLCLWGCR